MNILYINNKKAVESRCWTEKFGVNQCMIALDCITAIAKRYVADIFATLRRYEYNPELMRLYIVGGGGCLVRNFGQYDETRVTILDDICATAKGYEYLAHASLRRKE